MDAAAARFAWKRICRGLFLTSRKSDKIFITNLLPITHGCIYLLNIFLRRRLFIALHGQLNAFRPGTPLRATKPYFRLHGPLFRRDRCTRYILLGQSVRDSVKHLFRTDNPPIVIDHPYDYAEKIPPPPPLEPPLRFGQIGVGDSGKGTEKLFQLAEILKDRVESGQLEFHLVGRLDPALRLQANRWVKWYDRPLSEIDFSQKISELHYTLLLREGTSPIPSGSFFDSIKYEKPFLSLNDSFVEYYVNHSPGCGEMFKTIEKIAKKAQSIVSETNQSDYDRQVSALRNVRKVLDIQQIAEQFKWQLK